MCNKDSDSKSWTIRIKKLLYKFQLPSIYILLENPPKKDTWKLTVKKAVQKFYLNQLKGDLETQSSVKYINLETVNFYGTHNLWNTVGPSSRDVTRAMLKCKLLFGVYNLEGKRARFKNCSTKGYCPLCNSTIETRDHFVAGCQSLEHVRAPYVRDLKSCLLKYNSPERTHYALHQFTQTVMDPSTINYNEDFLKEAEDITRRLCFALHLRRTSLLNRDAQPPQMYPLAAAHPAVPKGAAP